MPVKGGYLLVAGAGGIFIWSGLKGKSWSSVLRNVLAGKAPQTTLTAYPIAPGTPASTTGSGGGGAGGGGSVPSVAGPGEKAWDVALLAAIGAPPTAANLHSLVAWR